jgi:transposase-like protein
MPEKRRKFDPEFREDAVRIIWETGKPIAQVASDLGKAEGLTRHGQHRQRHRAGGKRQPDHDYGHHPVQPGAGLWQSRREPADRMHLAPRALEQRVVDGYGTGCLAASSRTINFASASRTAGAESRLGRVAAQLRAHGVGHVRPMAFGAYEEQTVFDRT